jgi:large subunit ribosomal protein L25
MPEVTLVAEAGRTTGSRSTRRLRAAGKIPGVVYGHGSEPLPVAVGARDFQLAMSGEAGLNTLLSLSVDGKDYLTLARDIQRHPFKNVVTHVDFLIVRRDEVISAEVTINLVGDAVEVHHGDGIVEQLLFALPIKAKPADIPASVELDVSELTIGGALHVSDIVIPAGVELDTDPATTVVAGQPPRVQVTEEEAAEAGEGEGEAVAEGAAPAPSEEGAPAAATESESPSEG